MLSNRSQLRRCGTDVKLCKIMLLTLTSKLLNLSIQKPIFNRIYVVLSYKYSTGVSKWDEELTPKLKHDIENYWKTKIVSKEFDKDERNKQKMYVLSMFPYPSGKLHMGHVRVYTISDSVARFHRMNGKNVLHPIGWDAFGLPAENAAIANKIDAQTWTEQNIRVMKSQLVDLGCSFDWSREITTCDPEYYRWTQLLFIKMFNAGLVYQKKAFVNWDPVDKTVLAHEQVDENGFSWRSGAKIEKKLLRQWFIRTTRFAKQLLDNLDDPKLEDWRDIIKLQKHWIGKCDGVKFHLEIQGRNDETISVWTRNPEYLSQAAFVAVRHGHELCNGSNVHENTRKLEISAINPWNQRVMPIFATNEINFEEFSDMHLGIPVACQEDRDFARNAHLDFSEDIEIHSQEEKVRKQTEVCEEALKSGFGGYWTSCRLQDWLISRQRHWGTPIPVVHCAVCGPQTVPEQTLPVLLTPPGEGQVRAECPRCGGPAEQERDTMDTFVDSSWYYFRYLDPGNSARPFSEEAAHRMMPVDLYIGGKEHAVLHLYYARFVSHFLHSIGETPEPEPFRRLLVQGMIMGQTYRLKGTGKYVHESQINIIDKKKNRAVHKDTGQPVVVSWEKMSKSKLNGVDPEEMFEEHGVDTTRLLVLADVAPTSHRNWNKSTFPGIINWQRRLWLTMMDFTKHRTNVPQEIDKDMFEEHENKLWDSRNFYVKGTTFNYYTSQQMSVAVSKMQGLTNTLRRAPPYVIAKGAEFELALAVQIIMLAPMAPSFASELWTGFQGAPNQISPPQNKLFDITKPVLEQSWPEIDQHYQLELVCKTNGVENAVLKMPRSELESLDHATARSLALSQPQVQMYINARDILEVKFHVYRGYEGVVNVVTTKGHGKIVAP